MLATHPEEGKDLSFKGSMLVYMAENLEEVHQLINGDIYAKSGVWDLGKALVVPVSDSLLFFGHGAVRCVMLMVTVGSICRL